MNAKSMLIAAAVLATPACSVTQDEVAAAANDAVTARVDLLGETYLSRDTFTVTEYRRRPNGDYVADTITVRYRLRFIPAGAKTTKQTYGDYAYDGDGAMEYETVIDKVEVSAPALAYSDDVYYYAKRKDGNSFRLFDCDSTRNCHDGDRVSKLDVFKQNGQKVVKLSGLDVGDAQPGVYLEGVKTREILFDPTTAAPDWASLSNAMSCTSGDHTLTVAPVAPDTSNRAKVELTETSTGKVLDRDDYSVMKDALGRTYVVGPWAGLVITLGDHAARYENEVTNVNVDFAPGSCTIAK